MFIRKCAKGQSNTYGEFPPVLYMRKSRKSRTIRP